MKYDLYGSVEFGYFRIIQEHSSDRELDLILDIAIDFRVLESGFPAGEIYANGRHPTPLNWIAA